MVRGEALRPPGLESLCVFPAISDPFFGGAYDSGVFSLPPFAAFSAMHSEATAMPDWEESAFKTLPLAALDDAMFGHDVPPWEANLARNGQSAWPTPHWRNLNPHDQLISAPGA